jgi:hypothetical protein
VVTGFRVVVVDVESTLQVLQTLLVVMEAQGLLAVVVVVELVLQLEHV